MSSSSAKQRHLEQWKASRKLGAHIGYVVSFYEGRGGYGFLENEAQTGPDVAFHMSRVDLADKRTIEVGDKVEYWLDAVLPSRAFRVRKVAP